MTRFIILTHTAARHTACSSPKPRYIQAVCRLVSLDQMHSYQACHWVQLWPVDKDHFRQASTRAKLLSQSVHMATSI